MNDQRTRHEPIIQVQRVTAAYQGSVVIDDREQRWDRSSVHEFRGTYGDYILAKVVNVFPELGRDVL